MGPSILVLALLVVISDERVHARLDAVQPAKPLMCTAVKDLTKSTCGKDSTLAPGTAPIDALCAELAKPKSRQDETTTAFHYGCGFATTSDLHAEVQQEAAKCNASLALAEQQVASLQDLVSAMNTSFNAQLAAIDANLAKLGARVAAINTSNAETVDGLHASAFATGQQLAALNATVSQLGARVAAINTSNADTLDNFQASAFVPNTEMALGRVVLYEGTAAHNGNFGGLAGANVLCATAAKRPAYGRYRALLTVYGGVDFKDFPTAYDIPANIPVVSKSGTTLGSSWAALLSNGPLPNTFSQVLTTADNWFWHGFAGQKSDCLNWTSSSGFDVGSAGDDGAYSPNGWLAKQLPLGCSVAGLSLLCIAY